SLSGSIFSRQAQIRYTRRFHRGWKWTVAMEDPDSNDVIAQDSTQTRTAWPDITSTISASGERSHIQLGGLVRRITIDPDNASNFGTTGWGVHLSGHVDFGSREKLAAVFVAGQGLGRYMLGLSSTAGAFVDVDDGLILKRRAIGGFTTLRHKWNSPCRSTVGIGYATAETNPLQADDAFRASMIGIANLLCSVNRSITIGGEYEYGRRWNINRALDNNRFIFGLQLF
ncbi:MAG TPA: hypothetical protein VEX68_15350, partial [Bryobacteraceae bacterium]|nr:hypothetical protein [Bryobacteraceae bacterium]